MDIFAELNIRASTTFGYIPAIENVRTSWTVVGPFLFLRIIGVREMHEINYFN